ncbi:MAG TPA: D-glycero-beta-D-manno-heptose 1-phosphate adenylyltransferase [Saprospiraceae bacterium]|jgi:rfaE bifunctional protein nucleotidyltransferase chain/domain|nr:D-glycero-beta-D-manno-heptose 1-phosphate adenylyltransferase [Saprospiraceae bacterium]HMT69422.1 D-glycero-beta-D-manno-heptose 1-phosphate adenylyltransferase [Saprospiraceae bacterium]
MASIAEKVFGNHDCAVAQVKAWKDVGKKIVFTNGCFDLIHIGHVLYLEEAKSLGDILIVAANSDASVSKLKGPHRPIKDEYNRTHILAALASVDMVLVFDENDPYNIIKQIKPDVLVKGGDWTTEQIIGSDIVLSYGGQVQSLQFVPGYSTTALEQKIISNQ